MLRQAQHHTVTDVAEMGQLMLSCHVELVETFQ